jgi:hypothetical protein
VGISYLQLCAPYYVLYVIYKVFHKLFQNVHFHDRYYTSNEGKINVVANNLFTGKNRVNLLVWYLKRVICVNVSVRCVGINK